MHKTCTNSSHVRMLVELDMKSPSLVKDLLAIDGNGQRETQLLRLLP